MLIAAYSWHIACLSSMLEFLFIVLLCLPMIEFEAYFILILVLPGRTVEEADAPGGAQDRGHLGAHREATAETIHSNTLRSKFG